MLKTKVGQVKRQEFAYERSGRKQISSAVGLLAVLIFSVSVISGCSSTGKTYSVEEVSQNSSVPASFDASSRVSETSKNTVDYSAQRAMPAEAVDLRVSAAKKATQDADGVGKQAQDKLDRLAQSFYPQSLSNLKRSPVESISESVPTRLWQHYRQWESVPYRYGGVSKRGVDCSAFVQIAFNQKFGVSVPRTTRDQMRAGAKVSLSRLKVGDMVFFKTGHRTFHNGIYLGKQQFMHASSSRGVMISSIGQNYWAKRFYMARRVLE
ncbi:NlpC/P60 family protein [Thiomicrorhabdus sp. 6S3-12]|uniref:NlpC/P60 family protein n=1 Tax=Thiomicrorhabdus sp. 6S3-12 TaxID=2819681 RepID=UPI001AAE0221|nr:NlpC/P60 family protein [Thiomicrorhabdus sp. 6S3-12]MBO1924146.1 C40 family peptidase [Thiomicrorhabdus sp. 6S3-12]